MGSSGLDTSCSHWETQVASGDRCAQTDTRGSHSKVQLLEVTLSSMPSCLCRQHEEVSMQPPPGDLLCFPPLSASAGALGFLVRFKYTTYSSSRLNLRRRRPRSQGDTPKRRCPVTSAKRRERPGKAVRGKEEEFPRGKPRERSSPSRERPDWT